MDASLLINGYATEAKGDEEESWRQIPGYEGLYDASNLGRIRSAPGKTTSSKKFPRRVWKTRVMKQKVCPNIHGRIDPRVILWKDGKEHTHLVSRLIAMTWCDGYAAGLTVNHKDGNPMNNNANNLEWLSIADNVHHAFQTGLNRCNKRVALIDSADGSRREFISMSVASCWLGRNSGYISLVNQRGGKPKSTDGKIYSVEFL